MAPHRSQTLLGVINFNSSGDNTVIATVAGAPLNVYGIVFTVSGATNITFKDNSTALSGSFILTGNGSSFTLPMQDEPWFQILPGDAFIMNSSNAVTVGGMLWYTNG
jgi:hypothetical protein